MKYYLLILFFTSQIAFSQQKISPNDVLSLAACANDVEGMKSALKSGADINSTSSDGRTPLINAAFMGRVDAVRLLIEKKADLNRRDSTGTPALMYAVITSPEVAIALVKAGADVNITDSMGRTALMNTTDPEIKKLLKDAGAKEIKWGPPQIGASSPTSTPSATPLPATEPAATVRLHDTSTSNAPHISATPSINPIASASTAPSPLSSPATAERPTAKEEAPTNPAWMYALAAIILTGLGLVVYRRRNR